MATTPRPDTGPSTPGDAGVAADFGAQRDTGPAVIRDAGPTPRPDTGPIVRPDAGRRMCVATCSADSDCQNSCPANPAGSVCCDPATGSCYNSGTPTCPVPDPDGGMTMTSGM